MTNELAIGSPRIHSWEDVTELYGADYPVSPQETPPIKYIKPKRKPLLPEEHIEIPISGKNQIQVAGYCRVSTRDKQDPYIQVNDLKELYASKGWYGTIFIERHSSYREPSLNKRKVLKKIIEEIVARRWKGLAAVRPDRISRTK